MRIAVAGLIMNDAICSSGMSSGTGQAFSAGTTAYCDQLPPGGVAGEDPLAYRKALDLGAQCVDDGDPLEPGAGREMRCHTGVVAPDVEQIGWVDRAEPDLHPNLAGTRLRDGLLGDGQNILRFSVVIEANGLHFLVLSV